jgi:hypothetical protein
LNRSRLSALRGIAFRKRWNLNDSESSQSSLFRHVVWHLYAVCTQLYAACTQSTLLQLVADARPERSELVTG